GRHLHLQLLGLLGEVEEALLQLGELLVADLFAHHRALLVEDLFVLTQLVLLGLEVGLLLVEIGLELGLGGDALVHFEQRALKVDVTDLEVRKRGERNENQGEGSKTHRADPLGSWPLAGQVSRAYMPGMFKYGLSVGIFLAMPAFTK